ncbi:MAG TPA: hypothetical protein ENG98_03845 [Actinobacteria bacterium]|nr:foldase protein PrsA 3 precursor [bacterium BMS3Bbin02]HDL42125.1 hypothetical protein [Actinomycetota bacterium]
MYRRLLLLAGAIALVAAACSSTTRVLATVDGQDVTYDDLNALLTGEQTTVLNSETMRQDLATFIIQSIIIREAEALAGRSIPDEEVAEFVANPPFEYEATIRNIESDPRFSDLAVARQARLLISRQIVAESQIEGDETFVADIWNNNRTVLYVGCVRQIRTETEAEARAAYERIVGGEDFIAVAEEVSLDTQLGGNFLPDDNGQCPRPLSGFLSEFSDAAMNAEVGVVTEPVGTDAGFHLILVETRFGPESFEAWAADPLSFVTPGQIGDVFVPWYNDRLREAEITVDEAIGTWSPVGIGITPPEN